MENIIKSAGVLIFIDNKVLLVRHGEKAEHLNNTYGVPAGQIEQGELAIETAVKKLNEETGLIAATEDLINMPEVYTAAIERKDGSVKNFSQDTFLCVKWNGELKTTEKTIPEWINIDELEKLKLLPNVKKMVFDALRLKQNSV